MLDFTLEKLQYVAKADFTDSSHIENIRNQLNDIVELYLGHSEHEEKEILKILEAKSSSKIYRVLKDHKKHKIQFNRLITFLDKISLTKSKDKQIHLGYKFYLDLRKLFADILIHFDYEEKVIMPELQKLLTDDEIKAIDHSIYHQMTTEEMLGMLQVLFPHFNSNDKIVFISDLFHTEKDKFLKAWSHIKELLNNQEINCIEQSF